MPTILDAYHGAWSPAVITGHAASLNRGVAPQALKLPTLLRISRLGTTIPADITGDDNPEPNVFR